MNFKTDPEHRGVLVEITREQHDYMLNALPPIWACGCFGMGEALMHTKEGVAFHWAGERGGRYFTCWGTKKEAEAAFAGPTPTDLRR